MDIRPTSIPLTQLAPGAPAAAPGSDQATISKVSPSALKAEATPIEPEKIDEAIKSINAALQGRAHNLEFSTEGERTVIKVIDKSTKEVILQMPSQEALEIAKALDTLNGLMARQTA